MDIEADLRHAARWVSHAAQQATAPAFAPHYHALRRAADQLGAAWIGSWLPHLANLYQRNLDPLPEGLHRLANSGADHSPWVEQTCCRAWTVAEIRAAVFSRAGYSDERALQDAARDASGAFNVALLSLLAPLECAAARRPWDAKLAQLTAAARQVVVADKDALIEAWRPGYSRLLCAQARNFGAAPPHIEVLASLDALLSPFEGLLQIAALMRTAADHLQAPVPMTAPAGLVVEPGTALADARH